MTYREMTTAFLGQVAMRPGHLLEIRCLKTDADGIPRTLSGFYMDPAQAAGFGFWAEGKGFAVYYTLNPIAPGSAIGKVVKPNAVHKRDRERPDLPRAVKDEDIAHRSLLLVDIDPVRPGGCSTAAEKNAARVVAKEVKMYLFGRGWPAPIAVDSGNGYHLLWHIPPGTDGNTIRTILRYLAHMFDTEQAKVDCSVFNAARISRLPGTRNIKGVDTPERPHRRSRMLNYGAREAVSGEQIRSLALEGAWCSRPAPVEIDRRNLLVSESDVQKLLNELKELGALSLGTVTRKNGLIFWELIECPFIEGEHEGMTVGAGKTAIVLSPEYLGFSCFAGKCADHTFGDLMRLLSERHGVAINFQIYGDSDLAALEAKWGGVETAPYELEPRSPLQKALARSWSMEL